MAISILTTIQAILLHSNTCPMHWKTWCFGIPARMLKRIGQKIGWMLFGRINIGRKGKIAHIWYFLPKKVVLLFGRLRKSRTFAPHLRASAIRNDTIVAEIAQLVEHNLAKVGVASSSLVFRSVLIEGSFRDIFSRELLFFLIDPLFWMICWKD